MSSVNKGTDKDEAKQKAQRYEDMLRTKKAVYFDEDDLLDIAEYYYYDMSKDAEALQCLSYALKLHPESLPVKLRAAEITYFLGEKSKAWSMIRSLPEQEDPDVQYYYGLFSLEEHNLAEAEHYYRKAYSLEQGSGIELFCNIVSDYLEHNETSVLEGWFNLLPKAYANDVRVLEVESTYMQISGKLNKAEKTLEKLLDLDPYNADYWTDLTKINIETGNYDKARECIAYIIDIEPDNIAAQLLTAEVLYRMGEYEQAHEYYAKYIEANDKSAYVYYNNALCLLLLGREDEAMQQMHYARKFAGDEDKELAKNIHLTSSSLFIGKNMTDEAEKEFQKAEEYGIGSDVLEIQRAILFYKTDKKDKAVKIFDTMIDKSLSDGLFPMIVFNAYVMLNDANALLSSLNRMFERPDSNKCMQTLVDSSYTFYAYAYYCLNDERRFVENLKMAIEKDPVSLKATFAPIFPEDMDVKDYYAYASSGKLNAK